MRNVETVAEDVTHMNTNIDLRTLEQKHAPKENCVYTYTKTDIHTPNHTRICRRETFLRSAGAASVQGVRKLSQSHTRSCEVHTHRSCARSGLPFTAPRSLR